MTVHPLTYKDLRPLIENKRPILSCSKPPNTWYSITSVSKPPLKNFRPVVGHCLFWSKFWALLMSDAGAVFISKGNTTMASVCLFVFTYFFNLTQGHFPIAFRERGKERGETSIYLGEKHWLVVSCMHPAGGWYLQLWYVTWPRIEPENFGPWDDIPTNRVTLAKASVYLLRVKLLCIWVCLSLYLNNKLSLMVWGHYSNKRSQLLTIQYQSHLACVIVFHS